LAKSKGITFLGTSLLGLASGEVEIPASRVSTIADTWIHVSYVVQNGERNRALTIIKSRGTGHSNQVRELALTNKGLDLVDVYVGEGSVLLGSARVQKEQEEMRAESLAKITTRRRKFELDRCLAELDARTQAMIGELASRRQEAALEESAENVRIEFRRSAISARGTTRGRAKEIRVQPKRQRKRTGRKQ
jgi:circadian clock protein KaiC